MAALMLIAMTGIASADWVTATVTAGANPYAVAVNPVTNKIYVANYGSDNVTVIDGATNDTTTVAVGIEPQCRGGEPGHQQDLRRELRTATT